MMGFEYTIIADNSDVWDTPTDGTFRMFDGGTTIEADDRRGPRQGDRFDAGILHREDAQVHRHGMASGVRALQPSGRCQDDRRLPAEDFGTHRQAGPGQDPSRAWPSRRCLADSSAHIHGKKFGIYGDPDLCIGLAAFILECGGEPTHILSTNGTPKWAEKVQELLDSSPFGANCHVYPLRDLWHMRSLLFTVNRSTSSSATPTASIWSVTRALR